MIDLWRSLKKKSIPLTVQPMEGAVVCKTIIFLFHMKRFRFEPRTKKKLLILRIILIDYYKQYNKLEFETLEIHYVDLKV